MMSLNLLKDTGRNWWSMVEIQRQCGLVNPKYALKSARELVLKNAVTRSIMTTSPTRTTLARDNTGPFKHDRFRETER